jgi:hypothetical protein
MRRGSFETNLPNLSMQHRVKLVIKLKASNRRTKPCSTLTQRHQ